MPKNDNVDVTEFIKSIVRQLEKPPTPVQPNFSQGRSLKNPGFPSSNISRLTRGVVGVDGEGSLTAGE